MSGKGQSNPQSRKQFYQVFMLLPALPCTQIHRRQPSSSYLVGLIQMRFCQARHPVLLGSSQVPRKRNPTDAQHIRSCFALKCETTANML